METKSFYYAFMLRVWQVKHDGQLQWRASLEDPHTGTQKGFASLHQLLGFLQTLNRENDPLETEENDDHESEIEIH